MKNNVFIIIFILFFINTKYTTIIEMLLFLRCFVTLPWDLFDVILPSCCCFLLKKNYKDEKSSKVVLIKVCYTARQSVLKKPWKQSWQLTTIIIPSADVSESLMHSVHVESTSMWLLLKWYMPVLSQWITRPYLQHQSAKSCVVTISLTIKNISII